MRLENKRLMIRTDHHMVNRNSLQAKTSMMLSATLGIGLLSAFSSGADAQVAQEFHPAAAQLMERLDGEGSASSLSDALDRRERMLRHEFKILVKRDEESDVNHLLNFFRYSVSTHPEWIVFDKDEMEFVADADSIKAHLRGTGSIIPLGSDMKAGGILNNGWVDRLQFTADAREGFIYDVDEASEEIAEAINELSDEAWIEAESNVPSLTLRTASGEYVLQRLSKGLSNFMGSPLGRGENVRKSLSENLRGVIVYPGHEFSFNDTIKGSSGWKDAMVIVDGGKLVPEPGGGICQAATTVFRAAMLAGLPITKQANHSLYVKYYEDYGVGLDATIYPGKQDLSFRNDTGAPIVIVSRTVGDIAEVEIYGVDDGRTVAMTGPFFIDDNEWAAGEKPLKINQVGWTYDVTYADGSVVQDRVVSTYKALPKTLRTQYAEAGGIDMLKR